MSPIRLVVVIGIVLLVTGSLFAGMISTAGENAGSQLDIIGITGFTTTGADMTGLSVTVDFSVAGDQTCVWAATSATGGGCELANFFRISQEGDTFEPADSWRLENLSTVDRILSVTLNGTPARAVDQGVVFDRTFGGFFGTEASAQGADAKGTTTGTSNGSAVYMDMVAITPGAPVGDLFSILKITFDDDGLSSSQVAEFVADTDEVGSSLVLVPEPGTLSLLGLGSAIITLVSRRRLRCS